MTPVATVANKCTGCGHEWADKPGQFAVRYKDGCPKCGCLYWESKETEGEVKWLN